MFFAYSSLGCTLADSRSEDKENVGMLPKLPDDKERFFSHCLQFFRSTDSVEGLSESICLWCFFLAYLKYISSSDSLLELKSADRKENRESSWFPDRPITLCCSFRFFHMNFAARGTNLKNVRARGVKKSTNTENSVYRSTL